MGHASGSALARLCAVFGLATGFAAAVYWVAGAVIDDTGDDHAFGPYFVGAGLLAIFGVAALLVGAASATLLLYWRRVGNLSTSWEPFAVLVVVAAAVSAVAWRVCTAGVVGGNIGAGLWLLLAVMCWLASLVLGMAHAMRSLAH